MDDRELVGAQGKLLLVVRMVVLKTTFRVIFAVAALVLLVEAFRDLSAAKALLGVVMLAAFLRVR